VNTQSCVYVYFILFKCN